MASTASGMCAFQLLASTMISLYETWCHFACDIVRRCSSTPNVSGGQTQPLSAPSFHSMLSLLRDGQWLLPQWPAESTGLPHLTRTLPGRKMSPLPPPLNRNRLMLLAAVPCSANMRLADMSVAANIEGWRQLDRGGRFALKRLGYPRMFLEPRTTLTAWPAGRWQVWRAASFPPIKYMHQQPRVSKRPIRLPGCRVWRAVETRIPRRHACLARVGRRRR
mmetsp:Transcript_61349/g.136653  ORF Transcript_61349/g.136653 Transcript_61349/m.136653 type:complete len:220 (-) Transcript_61349:123-782(-)